MCIATEIYCQLGNHTAALHTQFCDREIWWEPCKGEDRKQERVQVQECYHCKEKQPPEKPHPEQTNPKAKDNKQLDRKKKAGREKVGEDEMSDEEIERKEKTKQQVKKTPVKEESPGYVADNET